MLSRIPRTPPGRVRLALLASCTLAVAALGVGASARAAGDTERRTAVVEAVERTGPAVVNISTEERIAVQGDPFFDEFFRDFFDAPQRSRRYTRTSLGSGVLIRPDGFVVTNAHVVARGDKIRVTLADEREFDARVVGVDPDLDIAVVKIDGDGLPHVELSAADDLIVGETAIAIGNPFGFSHTVTTGVISAVGRSLKTDGRTYLDFIQTDASINPGNSGGPLLNIQGDVVGINTAIYGKAQGIGFAIPSHRVRRATSDLIRFGAVKRGEIGVRVQDLTREIAAAMGLEATRGVVVREVDEGGPAERAGCRTGDVITAIDGHEIRSAQDFEAKTAALSDGETLRLEVLRGGERETLAVRAAAISDDRLDEIGVRLLGLRVKPSGSERVLEIREVRRDSAAARAGIRAGDALLALDGEALPSMADFRKAVGRLRGASQAAIVVQRGVRRYQVTLPIGE